MSTGIGTHWLQKKIDLLEERAIEKQRFDAEEITFLSDLYTTMYKGGRLLPPVKQTAEMMQHYLSRSGDDFRLDKKIFISSRGVVSKMSEMKLQIQSTSTPNNEYDSGTFYMPDRGNADSYFGLYWGRLIATPQYQDGKLLIKWRAEVPWEWPSYDSLRIKYGTPHAENFPLPNLSSIFISNRFSLFIDNGLGEYLVHLGIAKPFLAYAEWTEIVE